MSQAERIRFEEIKLIDAEKQRYKKNYRNAIANSYNRWERIKDIIYNLSVTAGEDFPLCTYVKYKSKIEPHVVGKDHCSECPIRDGKDCAKEILIVRESLTKLMADLINVQQRLDEL